MDYLQKLIGTSHQNPFSPIQDIYIYIYIYWISYCCVHFGLNFISISTCCLYFEPESLKTKNKSQCFPVGFPYQVLTIFNFSPMVVKNCFCVFIVRGFRYLHQDNSIYDNHLHAFGCNMTYVLKKNDNLSTAAPWDLLPKSIFLGP